MLDHHGHDVRALLTQVGGGLSGYRRFDNPPLRRSTTPPRGDAEEPAPAAPDGVPEPPVASAPEPALPLPGTALASNGTPSNGSSSFRAIANAPDIGSPPPPLAAHMVTAAPPDPPPLRLPLIEAALAGGMPHPSQGAGSTLARLQAAGR